MKKRPQPHRKTSRTSIPVTLRDILNFYPISSDKAFKIARVHRTTWRRWLDGTSHPPAATVELIRLHALGEPADPAFAGFRFVNGKLYDDCGRGYTPEDIRALEWHRIKSHQYLQAMEFYHFVPKSADNRGNVIPRPDGAPALRVIK